MEQGINISEIVSMVGEYAIKERQAHKQIAELEKNFAELQGHHQQMVAAIWICDFARWIMHQGNKKLSIVSIDR